MNTGDHNITSFDDRAEIDLTCVDDGGRRGFLFGGVAAALAALATACSSDPDDSSAGTSTTATGGDDTSPTPTEVETSETTATEGGDTAETPTSEGEGEGGGEASSDGKNQEADVPVREGDVDGGRDPNNPTAIEPSAQLADDLATISFAAGLEVLAVNTYRRASSAAAGGSLGSVPPAVSEFIGTVMGHHQAALNELNRALLLSGQPEVTSPDGNLQPVVDDAFAGVADVSGAARLALMLEEIAASTYLAAIPTLQSPEAIALAASIYPIDMQHASVLHFVLGEYPVPDVFGTTEKAASPS